MDLKSQLSSDKNSASGNQQLAGGAKLENFNIVDMRPGIPKPIQRKSAKKQTGLPDNLKTGIEHLSGYSMSDITVHYNSAKPAQLNAHAYAQGTHIHLAPGQEKHLPHEAWHTVQQKQGRVQPTAQTKSAAKINDDTRLESEADAMGTKALQLKAAGEIKLNTSIVSSSFIGSQPKSQDHHILNQINEEVSDDTVPLSATPGTVPRNEIVQLADGMLIVDDVGASREGQIGKTQFLTFMESQLRIVAKKVLEPVGLSQADCPDLAYWMNYYRGKDAITVEQSMKRYAPATASAVIWKDFAAAIMSRVEKGLIENIRTGSTEVDPEPAPEALVKERPQWSEVAQRANAPVQLRICGKNDQQEEREEEKKVEKRYSAKLFTNEKHTMVRGVDKPVLVYGMMSCGAGIAISSDRVFVHHIPSGHTPTFIAALEDAKIGSLEKVVMMISDNNSGLTVEDLRRSFAHDIRTVRALARDVEILYINGGSITVNNNGEYDLTGTRLLGTENDN